MNKLNVKLEGENQFVYEMQATVRAFKNQTGFIFEGNVRQIICSFPYTGYIKRGPVTCEKIWEITG